MLDSQTGWSPLYLLGILNSTLTTFWLRRTSSLFRGGYIALNRQYIEDIPLPDLDNSHAAERARHDRLVELVEQMLKCNSQLAAMKTTHERTALARQISATDEEIDRLVYELYALTDEEIRIVEEATTR